MSTLSLFQAPTLSLFNPFPIFSIFISRLFTAAYFVASMLLWSSFWNLFTVFLINCYGISYQGVPDQDIYFQLYLYLYFSSRSPRSRYLFPIVFVFLIKDLQIEIFISTGQVFLVKDSHLLASTTIASIILICAGCFNTVPSVKCISSIAKISENQSDNLNDDLKLNLCVKLLWKLIWKPIWCTRQESA